MTPRTVVPPRNLLAPDPAEPTATFHELWNKSTAGRPVRNMLAVNAPTAEPEQPAEGTGEAIETVTVTAPRGPKFTDHEKKMMAAMILSEGAREHTYDDDGLYQALGSVFLNRLNHPRFKGSESVEGLINSKEFQGVGGDLYTKAMADQLTGANRVAFEKAKAAVEGLVSGELRDNTGGAIFFHSGTLKPGSWLARRAALPNENDDKAVPARDDIGPFRFLRYRPGRGR